MFPTDWVKERIATLAKHHAVVWVEDPYRLLNDVDLAQLRAELAKRGQDVTRVECAYRLRQFLNKIDPVGSSPKFVVVDQAYTTRDPHVLPQDAKPSDLLALKGGLAAQLALLQEDLRYDAEDYYVQCRRRAGRTASAAVSDGGDETDSKDDGDTE